MVDDQHINLEILKQHVNKLGLDQITKYFINGQQVIDAVKDIVGQSLTLLTSEEDVPAALRPVSAILLDFQMPIKTGVQAVQEIKAYYESLRKTNPIASNLKDPDFVILTAFKTPHFETYLRSLGISDCFEKPIELEQLCQILLKAASQ